MQHLTQATIYWPRMNADITDHVKRWKICIQHNATQAVQPMLPRDILNGPWEDNATNSFIFNNNEYLLIAGTFSNTPSCIRSLPKQQTPSSRNYNSSFPRMDHQKDYQLTMEPHLLRSPSQIPIVPACRSHHFITPYPKFNGFIEYQVETIKITFSTSKASGTSLKNLLLIIRSTPIGLHMSSFREILHNHTEECRDNPLISSISNKYMTISSPEKLYKWNIMTTYTMPNPFLSSTQPRLSISQPYRA